jgi:hypothetical protein
MLEDECVEGSHVMQVRDVAQGNIGSAGDDQEGYLLQPMLNGKREFL